MSTWKKTWHFCRSNPIIFLPFLGVSLLFAGFCLLFYFLGTREEIVGLVQFLRTIGYAAGIAGMTELLWRHLREEDRKGWFVDGLGANAIPSVLLILGIMCCAVIGFAVFYVLAYALGFSNTNVVEQFFSSNLSVYLVIILTMFIVPALIVSPLSMAFPSRIHRGKRNNSIVKSFAIAKKQYWRQAALLLPLTVWAAFMPVLNSALTLFLTRQVEQGPVFWTYWGLSTGFDIVIMGVALPFIISWLTLCYAGHFQPEELKSPKKVKRSK